MSHAEQRQWFKSLCALAAREAVAEAVEALDLPLTALAMIDMESIPPTHNVYTGAAL